LLVSVELSGGWNGDLYAYLVHATGFAVLLDRVGYTGSGFGFGTAGMNVWLTDGTGVGNIETTLAPNSPNAGSPYSSNDYAGSLASFGNLNANGTWTLLVADLSGGGVTTVQSWGLQMDMKNKTRLVEADHARCKSNVGFTLIELLVVIAIIAILAAVHPSNDSLASEQNKLRNPFPSNGRLDDGRASGPVR
jgi:prepilin-type N-terminal cleavage/methylation domain-containing protein